MTAAAQPPATTAAASQPGGDTHNQSTAPTAPPQITCPSCRGCGKIDLPHPLLITLALLRALGTASAGDVYKLDNKGRQGRHVGVTAFNNRLEDLRRLGLVARLGKRGREALYAAV